MTLRDFRYALRSLKKSPGFVAVAVLSLGLGLGLVTTMFALLDAVKNPYVPYRDPERLYRVGWRWYGKLPIRQFEVFEAVRDRTRSFEAVLPVVSWFGASLEVGGELRDVNVARVPGRFFSLLGVRPRLGRMLTDADAARDVAVVSYPMTPYPTDALTLVLAETVLLAVTVAACLAPAFRAMRADPIEILRAT